MTRRRTCCPKCGGTTGVYTTEWQRWMLCWTWDGEEDGGDNEYGKGGKMLYCRDCHAPVMRTTTFDREVSE